MKKTVVALLALLLLVSLASCGLGPVVFRDVKWGMSPTQVERAESPNEYVLFTGGFMMFSDEVNGQRVEVYYEFEEDKLVEITQQFEWADVILKDQIDIYIAYRDELAAQFGEPLSSDYRVWTNYDPEFEDDSDVNQLYYQRMQYKTEYKTANSYAVLTLDYTDERVNFLLVITPL